MNENQVARAPRQGTRPVRNADAEPSALAPSRRRSGVFAGLRQLLGKRGSFDVSSPYPRRESLTRDADFEQLGLRREEADAFQELATAHQLDIFVRTGNAMRTANVGRPSLRPKPAGVYQKTSKEGYAPGLVLYHARELDKARRDIAAINHPDPHHASRSMSVMSTEGLHLRDIGGGYHGIRDRAGNFIYGDIDIHGVYARDARGQTRKVSADAFVPLFNQRLTATGLHSVDRLEYGTEMAEKEFGVMPFSPIQHGAHDEWVERNNAEYAGGVNMGPLPGVIHFSPAASPYHIETVPQYRDTLRGLGQEDVYSGAAWSNGRNRLATARYTRQSNLP
ncbi:hypothetical protein WM23_00010 [Burkholderia ubonensis]|nr:hypothetical protein WM23_00010 [Burkholderia ubonensis]